MRNEDDNLLVRAARFYIDGFRSMTVGRTLWIVILVKLAVMFVVLRLFFFRPVLSGRSAEERADIVIENLTTPKYDSYDGN